MRKQRRRGLGVKALEELRHQVLDGLYIASEDAYQQSEKYRLEISEKLEKKVFEKESQSHLEMVNKVMYHLGRSSGYGRAQGLVGEAFKKVGY